MNFDFLDKLMSYADRYYENGYLVYTIIGLSLFGLYMLVRLLSQ